MNSKTENLFVYGTLLKGESRSHYLKDCELLKTYSIPGNLYKTKFDFPAAIFDENSDNQIFGELYKLPNQSESFLKKLDEVESLEDKLFVRREINYRKHSFYIYEPGAGLEQDLLFENIIESGKWLTSFGLPIKQPKTFAKNFELIHREYYKKDPNKTFPNTIHLVGNNPILITCPHATVHIRKGKRKIMEIYTAAIGTILHSVLDCHCLYTNKVQDIDPNYYDECEFKERMEKVVSKNKIRFVMDLHGTGSKRKYDIYPGIGTDMEFLLGNKKVLENLYLRAKSNDISIGSLKVFPAVKQMTVTKFAAKKLDIPAMQIEVNQKLRIPNDKGDFERLIKFFNGFLKDVCKNFHSPPIRNP